MHTLVRHLTASAIVFDAAGRVLMVFHKGAQRWLPPGGHVEENEDFLQAAAREVFEETGIKAEAITGPQFGHPAVTFHPTPFLILEVPVSDPDFGDHRHIDLLYVMRATGGQLAAKEDEVDGVRWVHPAELDGLITAPEVPAIVEHAAAWVAQTMSSAQEM